MASNNYYSFTPAVAAQLGAFTGLSAYAAPAQAAVVQQAPTAFVATAPRLQTYDAYSSAPQGTTQHYALRTQPAAGNVADFFGAPIVQASPAYDSAAKAYYTPVAAVTPAPTGATIYTLPVDAAAVYQATQKKFYPVATPLVAPSASQATMYAVSAEPVYQTFGVGGAKSVYVANTFPTVTPNRQVPTAIRLIQAPSQPGAAGTSISIASYAYQPVQAPSVLYSNASLINVGSTITVTTAANTTRSTAGQTYAIYAPPGVNPAFTTITSSGNYMRLAPNSPVTTTVISSAASPNVSQPIANTRATVEAWHSRSSRVKCSAPVTQATVSSSSVTSQSPLHQMYYCNVCMISCAGAQTYKEHIEGQRHKKKEETVKSSHVGNTETSTPGRSNAIQMHCQLCDVACSGADTYAAHIRGVKHQKVLKLHSSLGRQTTSSAGPVGTVAAGAGVKRSIGNKEMESSVDDIDMMTYGESDTQPIGHEYIEEARNESGVAVGFYCKLCDCKFTDPNAKLMHMKGRRHRSQYKKKVDPNLAVDLKPAYGWRAKEEERESKLQEEMRRRYMEDKWRMECEQLRYEDALMTMHRHPGLPAGPTYGSQPPFGSQPRRSDNYNDKQVMSRHSAIYPNEQELECVQNTVAVVEKALKLVADSFVESSSVNLGDVSTLLNADRVKSSDQPIDSRVLRSFVRVGPLAKGLLLHGDLHLHLVALCTEKPTRTLLDTVVDRMTKQLQALAADEFEVKLCVEEAGFIVERTSIPNVTCNITLTSPIIRDPMLALIPELTAGAVVATVSVSKTDPPDVLDRQKCLAALAEQRRTKWFQARVSDVHSCLIILRVMRDICQRIPGWELVTDWMLELLVEKCIIGLGGLETLTPGNALRRVFECVASGVLLTGGPGLYDPCEKDEIDVCDTLSNQDREKITASAQLAVRYIAFRQIHRLLGLSPTATNSSCGSDQLVPRKRPFSECSGVRSDENHDVLKESRT